MKLHVSLNPVFAFQLDQLSDLERDTLNHYPNTVTPRLYLVFRGAIMVFSNLVGELWRQGLRIRIVPDDMKMTDLPECIDMRKYRDKKTGLYTVRKERISGFYVPSEKLLVINERDLLEVVATNQRHKVFIHEMAHAIWYLILNHIDRLSVAALYEQEILDQNERQSYRLSNPQEFFAEAFRYFLTPERYGPIMLVTGNRKLHAFDECRSFMGEPGRKTLETLNIKLYAFLESKFKDLVNPDLVVDQMYNRDDEISWEYNRQTGVYDQVINVYL